MRKRILILLPVLALCVCRAVAQNNIEPGKEEYSAVKKTITADGNLSDWAGVTMFKDVKFMIPKNAPEQLVSFETLSGATSIAADSVWSGPEDHSNAWAITWDEDNLYIGIVVTDDYHQSNATGPTSAWNGDSLQVLITDADRTIDNIRYNYALGGEEGALTEVFIHEERGPGGTEAFIVRDEAKKETYYELKLPASSMVDVEKFEAGMQFGIGLCINDGDLDSPGQAGWSGWGVHSIVHGKTASHTGLVTLTAGGGPVPAREYSIGLNFGADEPDGAASGALAATDVAGVPSVAQPNWNNLTLLSGTNNTIVADASGTSEPTTVTVSWSSANTWSSTGRGEENNQFTGNELKLTTGYLDTGGATTSTVRIVNLPARLTSGGYDAYVYALGGVGGRGGSFRILDASTGTVLHDYIRAQSPTNSSEYIEVPTNLGATAGTGNRTASQIFGVGNYMVFRGLKASEIIVEARTGAASTGFGFSGTPRAPINAIQLVVPTTGSDIQDVTRPGDTIVSSNDPARSPAAEQVANAIDNNRNTKYLNFGNDTDTVAPFVGPVGLTVTPGVGATVVTGLGLTSANDAPERDPASYRLEGSNDGTTFTLISEGEVPPFSARFIRQEILFANVASYRTYRLTFPTVVNEATANSMQIAEIELLGTAVGAPPTPISITRVGAQITINYKGTLHSSNDVAGPYAPVAGATSPYNVTPEGTARFYIAR